MEQNFQTSFIPKKPIVEEKVKYKKPVGIFTFLTILFFLVVLFAYLGLYFYKLSIDKKIVQKNTDAEANFKKFEFDKIEKLETLDKKLKIANVILDEHITVSPIFKELQGITMKSIRFTSFNYELGEKGNILVKLKGQAPGYKKIALQSDLFFENKNLKSPIFSNLALDDKGEVSFDLEFSLDKTFVGYKQLLERERINVDAKPVVNEPVSASELIMGNN